MERCQMLLVLVGLAVALSGCGGDEKKATDTPAKLTSQTVTGGFTDHETTAGLPLDFSVQLTAYFDADTLNIRVDGQVTLKGFNASEPQTFGVIVNTGEKKVTMHQALSVEKPVEVPTCTYRIVEGAPPLETIKSLLKDKIESRKPDGVDGGYRRWNLDVPELAGLTGHVSMDLDDENGLRKVYESLKRNSTISMESEATFTASDVKIGKPDAGLFQAPKDWGECVEAPRGTAFAAEGLPEPWRLAAALAGHAATAALQPLRAEGDEALLVV